MPKRNVVLVCGGRAYPNAANVFDTLDRQHKRKPITLIVQGYAGRRKDGRLVGADRLADQWARSRNVPSTGEKYRVTDQDWTKYGKGAGHIRNKKMLDEERPDRIVAFPGDAGTDNMCSISEDEGITVIRITDKGRSR